MVEKVDCKKIVPVSVGSGALLVPSVAMADSTTVDYSTMSGVVTALQAQVNNTNILSVIVGGITISIGFVFLFWGIRYVYRRLRRASQGKGMTP